MNDLLNRLSNMRPSQWLLIGGFAMTFISISTGVAGVEIHDGMHLMAFAGGITLILVGAAMSISAAKYASKDAARKLDAELRKEKLDAGLDPKKDKTIYKA